MPHAGLMGDRDRGPVEGPLMRARLHVRGAKRRLRQGKIAAGIVTLYDALEAAMDSYAADDAHRAALLQVRPEDLKSTRRLYRALVSAGVLDKSFDFDAFDGLTDRALNEELPGYDYAWVLTGLEDALTRLGVLPFQESSLPPEDPETY